MATSTDPHATLAGAAREIMREGRHAGHPFPTILMALEYASEAAQKQNGSPGAPGAPINHAATKLRRVKGQGCPPRWLVDRWAHDAGLTPNS